MKGLGDDHRGHAQGQPDEKQRQEPADPFLPRDLEDAQGGHKIALRGDEDVGLTGDADQVPEGRQDRPGGPPLLRGEPPQGLQRSRISFSFVATSSSIFLTCSSRRD